MRRMNHAQSCKSSGQPLARASRWWLAVSASCLLAACTTGPYAPPPPVIAPQPEAPATRESAPQTLPPSSPTPSTQSPSMESSRTIARGVRTERVQPTAAARALIQRAQAERRAGNYSQAASLLERAQRMSPQAADVYLELALVKAAEGAYAQAEQFGQKAISLSGSDEGFRRQTWQVIADIREARGDRAGAAEARRLAARQG